MLLPRRPTPIRLRGGGHRARTHRGRDRGGCGSRRGQRQGGRASARRPRQPKQNAGETMTRSVKSTRTCGDCQFYTPTIGYRGDCRRSAPVVIHSGTCWPQVSPTTGTCGEFKLHRKTKTITKDLIDWAIFSTHVKSALRRASIASWGQLQQFETDDLLAIPGIGAVAVQEISEARNSRRSKGPARTRNRANGEGR